MHFRYIFLQRKCIFYTLIQLIFKSFLHIFIGLWQWRRQHRYRILSIVSPAKRTPPVRLRKIFHLTAQPAIHDFFCLFVFISLIVSGQLHIIRYPIFIKGRPAQIIIMKMPYFPLAVFFDKINAISGPYPVSPNLHALLIYPTSFDLFGLAGCARTQRYLTPIDTRHSAVPGSPVHNPPAYKTATGCVSGHRNGPGSPASPCR